MAANYLVGLLALRPGWGALRRGRLRTLHRRLPGTTSGAETGRRTRMVLRKVLGVPKERFRMEAAGHATRLARRPAA